MLCPLVDMIKPVENFCSVFWVEILPRVTWIGMFGWLRQVWLAFHHKWYRHEFSENGQWKITARNDFSGTLWVEFSYPPDRDIAVPKTPGASFQHGPETLLSVQASLSIWPCPEKGGWGLAYSRHSLTTVEWTKFDLPNFGVSLKIFGQTKHGENNVSKIVISWYSLKWSLMLGF